MPSIHATGRRRGVCLVAGAAMVLSTASFGSATAQTTSQTTALNGTKTGTSAADAARPSLSTRATRAATGAVPGHLRLYQERESLLGVHRWYQQVKDGYDVVGGWYAVHTWDDHTTTVADGRRHVTGLASRPATVTPAQAASRVATTDKSAAAPSTSDRRKVLPGGNGAPARLVWEVVTTDGHGVTATYVDSSSGALVHKVQLATSARPDTRSHRQPKARVTGRGRVFDPNPVVAVQDETLKDQNDSNAAVPARSYRKVNLPRLNDRHTLVGRWVRIVNATRAHEKDDRYLYRRDNDLFEQVNTYHAVDSAQNYLQRLDFQEINAESQDMKTNAFAEDNSYYSPRSDRIALGRGGVDDAEDPEVIWHEYGHAIQDDQVPNFGRSTQAGSIGEGFGDYFAAVMSQGSKPADTRKTPSACVMDWDATSYTSRKPHCLRRTDTNLTFGDRDGEVHDDGRIWSRALWDMNRKLGRNRAASIIIEAQFSFTPRITMGQAGDATIATAQDLYPYNPSIADVTRRAFENRKIPVTAKAG